MGEVLSFAYQDGDSGMRQDPGCLTAEEYTGEPPTAMRRHHDKITPPASRSLENALPRMLMGTQHGTAAHAQ